MNTIAPSPETPTGCDSKFPLTIAFLKSEYQKIEKMKDLVGGGTFSMAGSHVQSEIKACLSELGAEL